MGFPQTTYSNDPPIGKLGMLYRTSVGTHDVESLPALEDGILPGDLLERVIDGTTGLACVRKAQSANGAQKDLAGVAIYKDAVQPRSITASTNGFMKGDLIAFCRRGKVFAAWVSADGTTAQAAYTSPNYASSSDKSGAYGAFTDKATATTLHSEVFASPSGVRLDKDVTASLGFGVCLVELNLP